MEYSSKIEKSAKVFMPMLGLRGKIYQLSTACSVH